MALKIVGISEIYVSKNPTDELVAHSLGSCIGLTVYDPVAKVGGMIQYMLPLSKIAPAKAKDKPGMFGDTGVPELLRKVCDMGASKEH